MDPYAPRYVEVELWDKLGNRIADISRMAESRSFALQRNGVNTFQFSIDLDRFNRYCVRVGVLPRTLLWPLQTMVRVKLGGVYKWGFVVAAVTPYLNETGSTLSVRCTDPLDLLSKRYVSKTYGQVEQTTIAWDLIATTQAQANGSLGITQGAQYTSGTKRDRQYDRKSVKEALIELTQLDNGNNFDFRFTHDFKFETYDNIGSVRTANVLRYGDGGNIKSVEVPTEGMAISNRVTGLGSGFGADQLTSTQTDTSSQLNYYVLEELAQFSDVSVQKTLDENTAGYLALTKDMLQIPRITVNQSAIDLAATSVGDRFPVDLTAHPYTDNIKGLYRVDQMNITFDENDFADAITLQFDDQGVDKNESA